MRILAIAASVTAVAFIGATGFVAFKKPSNDDPFAACRGGAVGGGAIGGYFELVREDGVTVQEDDVFTKPTILYFGYTFCPDVCPMDSMRNADALRVLEDEGYEAQAAFISIDPERDDVETVADFTDLFHEDMIGLTGSVEQVKAASQAYKTYFKKQDDDPEYYLVDHSTFSYLVLPEIGFVDFFRRDVASQDMADRVACFIEATG